VKTTPEAMERFFVDREKARVVVEVGAHSRWAVGRNKYIRRGGNKPSDLRGCARSRTRASSSLC
jgi:hypothetical protein